MIMAEPLDVPLVELSTVYLLTEGGRYPTRRTWERHLKAWPDSLPAQIGCPGRYRVGLVQARLAYAHSVAIDTTILVAYGGVWHQ